MHSEVKFKRQRRKGQPQDHSESANTASYRQGEYLPTTETATSMINLVNVNSERKQAATISDDEPPISTAASAAPQECRHTRQPPAEHDRQTTLSKGRVVGVFGS